MRVGLFVAVAGRRDSGPETYEHCLLRALAASPEPHDYEVFCLNQAAADSFGVRQDNVRFRVLRPQNRWLSMSVTLPAALARSRVQFYHATLYPPLLSPKPLVMTMHGTDMFLHPEFFSKAVRLRLQLLLARGLRKAGQIIAVSQHVRDFLAERFRIADNRLSVVYHGVDPNFRPGDPDETREVLCQRYGIARDYILYAGKLVASKNIHRLVESFVRFRHQTGSDLQLVLAGRTYPKMTTLDEKTWHLAAENNVVRLGQIPHEDLPPLYQGARFTVFPSLWEGFGLPVLESMACGTPVITSNVSCLPEVSGGNALLVDPHSVEALTAALVQLDSDTALRQQLRDQGLQWASRFTWSRTAEQTLDVYRRLVG